MENYKRPFAIRQAVTAADVTATQVVIDLHSETNLYSEFIGLIQIYSSSSVEKTGAGYTYSADAGTLTVTEQGSFTFAAGDIVTVIGHVN